MKIIKAWINWILYKQPYFAKKRFVVCRRCNKNKCGVCTDCGCVIRAKVRCKICECKKWQ